MAQKFAQVKTQASQIAALAGRLSSQMQYEAGSLQPIEVEALYSKAARLKETIGELVDDFHDENPVLFSGKSGTVRIPIHDISIEQDGGIGIRFDAPPILKSSIGVRTFAEEFCIELQQKLVMALPGDFKKFSAAYVIYVSHFIMSEPKRQPYFDNDNLSIKQILDSVVPYICLDDASKFCDNLYFSQPDSECYAELFVVEKSKIYGWIQSHQAIPFCREVMKLRG